MAYFKIPEQEVLEYVITYRESPDSPQLQTTKPTKQEADALAFKIYTDGGIAIITTQKRKHTPKFSNMNIEDLE